MTDLLSDIQHPNDLLASMPDAVIFESIVGSRAYGTHRPNSDRDVRGIFVLPRSYYLTIDDPRRQVSDERNDTTYYTLHRFIQLAVTANPNIIELLFMPDDCVLKSTPVMDRLVANRSLFVTKAAYASHIGYAQAQVRRAKGQNKWVNNPQPEEPPRREDFCWIVPREGVELSARHGVVRLPYRPVPVREYGIDLEECHCAALEHAGYLYRLYHYGPESGDRDVKGVFRKGNLVCESVPVNHEDSHCVGLLIYNRPAFERAKRNHKQYWQWRRERNDARWETQEAGATDYDAKNMMHTIRLLLSGESLFRYGKPIVRFGGEQLELLLGIRDGRYGYDELISMTEDKVASLAELREAADLPDAADRDRANGLLTELTEMWEAQHA